MNKDDHRNSARRGQEPGRFAAEIEEGYQSVARTCTLRGTFCQLMRSRGDDEHQTRTPLSDMHTKPIHT